MHWKVRSERLVHRYKCKWNIPNAGLKNEILSLARAHKPHCSLVCVENLLQDPGGMFDDRGARTNL